MAHIHSEESFLTELKDIQDRAMQIIRSEVTRLFAIGFIAGSLMVGAMMSGDFEMSLAGEAYAADIAAPAE